MKKYISYVSACVRRKKYVWTLRLARFALDNKCDLLGQIVASYSKNCIEVGQFSAERGRSHMALSVM